MNLSLKPSDFHYDLPAELIAHQPSVPRSKSRMILLEKKTGVISHHLFSDLGRFLNRGDLLVVNNTKVLPARLYGARKTGAKVEALLLKKCSPSTWKMLIKPGGRIKKGEQIVFSKQTSALTAEVLDDPGMDSGERELRFLDPNADSELHTIGHMPLPPYIRRPAQSSDQKSYQTVFASREGAVAAPTAGLHFDQEILSQLKQLGVDLVEITLHVGYGTFQPILTDDFIQHKMHEESYEISEEAAAKINRAKKENRRVIACGTTVVRALESAVSKEGKLASKVGLTQLFIYPPFTFRIVNALLTNFHLPESTLLILVCSFTGKNEVMSAYKEAIQNRYRFFSYGDCMLIV